MVVVVMVVVMVVLVVREWRLLTWAQVLLCSSCLILAGGGLWSPPSQEPPSPRPSSSLTWLAYSEVCLGSSGHLTTGEAAVCQHFTGLGVTWAGQVTRLHIKQRTNTLETFLHYIPHNIRAWTNVDCILGHRSDIRAY